MLPSSQPLEGWQQHALGDHQWQVQTFMHGVTMQDPDGFIEHGGWNFLDAEGDGSDEEGDDEEEEGEQSSPSCSGDQRLSSVPTADSRDEEGAASPSVSWLCCLKDPMECRFVLAACQKAESH